MVRVGPVDCPSDPDGVLGNLYACDRKAIEEKFPGCSASYRVRPGVPGKKVRVAGPAGTAVAACQMACELIQRNLLNGQPDAAKPASDDDVDDDSWNDPP